IDEIFQATTQEVRQLLDVDRVAIYRFNADWSGQFVTDSLSEEKDRLDPQPPQRIAVTQANSEGQYPRHETFVPISHGEQLWGLLIAYQSHEPRYWQTDEISLLTQVGAQLGVALNQAELLTQTRQQSVKLEQALAKLQQTQTQLIQNEKMAGLGQLVAGIAHEINNPVNFIFGNIPHANEQVQGLLSLIRQYQTHYPNPPADIGQQIDLLELDFVETDLPKVIDSMAVGAQRIQEIVKGLRVFSRTDEVDIKRVDLHEGLNSTLMILGHRLKAHEGRAAIQVELDYGNLPLVECYPGPLNQVFMNLLNNALDALDALGALSEETHPAPTVTIRTMARPDSIQVEIEDNGAGMSEAVRSQIFNPFFTTKPIGQGTGLGLSISHSIVTERHGGQIRCTSAPGQGTTFTLQLPRQATNRSVSHLT
ncbi:MAG: ATP-binding protein, partial [Cyanobacteria bacterium P01_A01_bin.105]